MGLTPWETHRDFLVWQKAKAQRDLATLKSIPAFILETREAKERGLTIRHQELMVKIQEKIDTYAARLAKWEQKRPNDLHSDNGERK